MATACPWLVLLTIPLGWAYAKSTYGVLGGDGYSWMTQAARMDVWDATTLVTPFHNLGWAVILSNAAQFPASVLTVSRIASVAFATLARRVAVELTRSLASARALFFAALSIVPGVASYVASGGTDLPATTMQLVAVYFFLRTRRLRQWLAGVAIGIGFWFRPVASRGSEGLAAAVDDPRTTFVLLSRESLRYDEEAMACLETALTARFEPICMPDLDPSNPQLAAFRRRARAEPPPAAARANDDATTSAPVPAADQLNETQP